MFGVYLVQKIDKLKWASHIDSKNVDPYKLVVK